MLSSATQSWLRGRCRILLVGNFLSGAGMAPYYRAEYLAFPAGTHTEFTRVLAEHGLLGLIALLLLAYILWNAYRRTQGTLERTIAIAFLAWTIVEMGHSATRIAAIPFCLGVVVAVSNSGRPKNSSR